VRWKSKNGNRRGEDVDAFRRPERKPLDIEAELRAACPAPRERFLHELSADIRSGNRSRAPRQIGFAVALTAALLIALAAVGGVGYAASAASHAANAVTNVVAKSHQPTNHVPTVQVSPAQTQYRPGCGLGDKNHVHTGPPGQGGVCPAHRTPGSP
jgi:hypothetical protein